MKRSFIGMAQRILFILVLALTSVWVLAQDTTSSSSSTTVTRESTTTTEWYTQPWVWIVGGAVFLIILVALLRGSSNTSNKEVSRTTVIKDKDT